MCSGLRGGVSELELPCFTTERAEVSLMPGSAFGVTDDTFSSGAGGTTDGNGSHGSTSTSYTKSVSWHHEPVGDIGWFGNLSDRTIRAEFPKVIYYSEQLFSITLDG